MGFKVKDLRNSKYVAKDDVGLDGVLVTITGCKKENVALDTEAPDIKWTVLFDGVDIEGKPIKPLVCNLTNGVAIEAIVGSGNSDDWVGHQIVLYNDPAIQYRGKVTGGIRVRKHSVDPGRQIPTTPVEDGPPVASEADMASHKEIPYEPKY